jgi:succinate dehydrogenase/fumarate reductase flavoprotein subunit
MNPDFEVIVVGGGVAGLAAAISAREAGASVVVLEAQDHLGGSSALSGGHLYAAGTRYQRERGIVDHPDDLFEYFSTLNQFRVDPALVRTFAMNAPAAIEWAIAHGAEVGAPDRCDNSPVFRGHRVVGYGAGLMAALERSARSLGVEIVFRTRVRRLVLEGERVTGVEVDGQPFRAGAVVVATGGFAQNRELIERHYPEALSGGDWVASHANPASQGDALELGQQAGADLTGENRGLFVVRPRFRQYGESKRFIYVNERGRRFINEAAYYSTVAHAIRRQGGRAFMVFDDRTRSFFNGDYDRSAPFRA